MKLLLDQNLAPKLAARLADLFPGSAHVQSVNLDCADDDQVWQYAQHNGFAVVTKDEDYNHVESIFRSHFADIEAFANDSSAGTLVLS